MEHDDQHKPKTEPKNLVICCDGTGNEISENISNVLKLYRCLRKTDKTKPRQMVFYDPGVGTVTEPSTWHRLKANVNLVLGLATGYGLDDNVLSAYCFLVEHYAPGDRIYLFGFSRGAYTVRVLAGLIHKIGLISPEQANLAGPASSPTSNIPAPGAATTSRTSRMSPSTRAGRCRRTNSTSPPSSRASPRRAGRPSTSSASGTRWRA